MKCSQLKNKEYKSKDWSIDQSVFYQYYQKYLKKLFMTSFMNIYVSYCVVSEKHIPRDMLSLD